MLKTKLHSSLAKLKLSDKNRPSAAALARDFGLLAKKSLGQNFLFDQNITDKIVRAALTQLPLAMDELVLEIGPGPGGLTISILEAGFDAVAAIERDERAMRLLLTLSAHYPNRLTLFSGDALTTDYTKILAQSGKKTLRIIANLPYNIATVLLLKWLKLMPDLRISQMVLMFQKEVGDRIVANVNCKKYSRISVIAQSCCHAKTLFTLPPSVFVPQPKIHSSVISFIPKNTIPSRLTLDRLEKLTAIMFNTRRKMIGKTLEAMSADLMSEAKKFGISPSQRAEQLTVEQFLLLTNSNLT